ncbi:nucleoside triphosphate pyrophosphohydrolase, partial [human gut metagenome]
MARGKDPEKAAKTGFRWESADEALDKLAEETGELREAVRDHTNIDEELGDVLFAAVRVASTLERDPEQALHAACEKFIRRFTAME